jgi:hypothetical protein
VGPGVGGVRKEEKAKKSEKKRMKYDENVVKDGN